MTDILTLIFGFIYTIFQFFIYTIFQFFIYTILFIQSDAIPNDEKYR